MPTLGDEIRGAAGRAQAPTDERTMLLMAIMQMLQNTGRSVQEFFETRRSLERHGWAKEQYEQEKKDRLFSNSVETALDAIDKGDASLSDFADNPRLQRALIERGATRQAPHHMSVSAVLGDVEKNFQTQKSSSRLPLNDAQVKDIRNLSSRYHTGEFRTIAEKIALENPKLPDRIRAWDKAFGPSLASQTELWSPHISDTMVDAMRAAGFGEMPGVQDIWGPEAEEAMINHPDPLKQALYFTGKNNPTVKQKMSEHALTDAFSTEELRRQFGDAGTALHDELAAALTSEESIKKNLVRLKPTRVQVGYKAPFKSQFGPEPKEETGPVYNWFATGTDQIEPYKTEDEARRAQVEYIRDNPRQAYFNFLMSERQRLEKEKQKTAPE